MKTYYYIDDMGYIQSAEAEGWELSYKLRKMISNYFKTELEAEAYIDYLLAREVIKEDAKGFKPNWKDYNQPKFSLFYVDGYYSYKKSFILKASTIYFETEDDMDESLDKHRKEWKTYLTYKQQ